MNRIGFITGIKVEANILRKASKYSKSIIISVENTEGGAYEEADTIAKSGCDILISFGFAGALDPRLAAGDLVIPNSVVDSERKIYKVDYKLHGKLTKRFSKNLKPSNGRLFSSDAVITDTTSKKKIFNMFNAVAVDMESAGVAKAATENNCSFMIIRAISDTAYQNLPRRSLNSFYLGNSVKIGNILLDLARNLHELPEFTNLTYNSYKAFSSLRRIARLGLGI